MTNFQQYCHKMAEFRLNALCGLDDVVLEQKVAELAGEHGAVQSIRKLGDDIPKGKSYLICFACKEDAQRAMFALGARPFNETSVILVLH